MAGADATTGRRASRPRSGSERGAARWPLDSAGPDTSATCRNVGELTILELTGTPSLSCPAKTEATLSFKGFVLLVGLARGECAYRASDGRLAAMRPREVLVLESGAAAELRGQADTRL